MFQGINDIKALSHVIGTKCMHINRYGYSIDKARLSRYKDLQIIKSAKKGLLNDYSQKWSLPYHTYRISYHKFLSQIFSVTPGVIPHKISLQHLMHHPSAQDIAHHLTTTKSLIKKVQFLLWVTITHTKLWLPMRHALQ